MGDDSTARLDGLLKTRMKFVDSCEVRVVAGDGGNGCVAFRREKFVPRGGPSGGDGGKGGDILFAGDEGKTTLLDVALARVLRAEHGEHGRGKDQYGASGIDLVVKVPVGTQGFDAHSNERLFDIDAPGKPVVVARGGRGGRGNIHFATPFDRAPRRAEPGTPGEDKTLRLELKVLADVGLLGFPNVGKSTFVSSVSRARPKIAEYPFTTLMPHLGVVRVGEESSFVLADIPGLIPGAAEGVGLGIRFLKHVERTRALLHLVTVDPSEGRDPLADFEAINAELSKFDPELARRPQVVAMSKGDLPEVSEAWTDAREKFAGRGIELMLVSAATGQGVREVLAALWTVLTTSPRLGATESTRSDCGGAR
jgi:GTP-binding protein